MKNKIPRPTVIIFAIFTVLLLSVPAVPSVSAEVADKYIILYDVSHGQNFTLANLTGAFDALSAIEEKYNTQIEIIEFNQTFTNTNLQGADLLIITNPGENASTTEEEKTALTNYVQDGGGVLYLGNPLAKDGNITGHPKLLNDFMNEPYNNFGAFHVGDARQEDSPTILIDEENNDGYNESYLVLNSSSVNEEAIVSGVMEFEDVVFYGSGIRDTYTGSRKSYSNYVKGNVSSSTYFVGENYNPNFNAISWILGRQMQDAEGRTMSLGSTIMFSDLEYRDGQSWIDTRGNKALFVNMVAWLMQITPEEEVVPIAEVGVSFTTWLGYVLLGTIVGFAIIFGYQILTGKLEASKIFDFKKPITKIQPKKTKPKAKSKKKKARK